jgi:hypothetical protein
MSVARAYHTMTLLPNGKVLVAGGGNRTIANLSSAELYDPATGTWIATGSMTTSHQAHTANLIPNGKVLVAGGSGASAAVATAEIYEPATGIWTATAAMNTARIGHVAAVLPSSNKVLVAGGNDANGVALSSAELYDPGWGLFINMYAGLTISAPVGSTNQIQYVNDLNNPNWIPLTNLVLPSNPYIFIDYGSPSQSHRFYRDVPLP